MAEKDVERQKLLFTEDDLAANREGRLSEAQISSLRDSVRFIGRLCAAGIIVALIIPAIFAVFGAKIDLLTIAITAFTLLVSIFMLWFWVRPRWLDLCRGIVISETAAAELRVVSRRWAKDSFRVKFGHLDLTVEPETYSLFEAGKLYRIYLMPESKTIEGISRLHDSGTETIVPIYIRTP